MTLSSNGGARHRSARTLLFLHPILSGTNQMRCKLKWGARLVPGTRASFLPSDNNRETAIRLCREICHKLPYQYQHAHPIIARVHINDQTADTRVSGSLIVCYVSICSKIKTRLSFSTCFGVSAALYIMRFRYNIMQYFCRRNLATVLPYAFLRSARLFQLMVGSPSPRSHHTVAGSPSPQSHFNGGVLPSSHHFIIAIINANPQPYRLRELSSQCLHQQRWCAVQSKLAATD